VVASRIVLVAKTYALALWFLASALALPTISVIYFRVSDLVTEIPDLVAFAVNSFSRVNFYYFVS